MKRLILLFAIAALMFSSCGEKATITVANLRCEKLADPEGIDRAMPSLSWEINADAKGVMQTKFHVLVASSPEKLAANEGDLWDSQELKSGNSIDVEYGGAALQSRAECFWKVKVTTNKGASDWSRPARWTMGLLNDSDWKATWTGLDKSFKNDVTEDKTRLAARYLRKEFTTEDKPVAKATLYISGLGMYEAYINGNRIGDYVFSPTPTDYTKSVKYNTYDVTSQLTKGANAIGVALGNGRYFAMRTKNQRTFGFPKLLAQLEITYKDGTVQTIASNNEWKVTADGPILANNEFDGEEYDARKEMPGWNKAGFDDKAWMAAETVQAPGGKIGAQLNRNMKVMETIKPVGIKETGNTYILDMGQNMVGWLKMKVKGKAGDRVKLRFAELLKPDGTLYMANLRSALVTDIYTLKSDGEETWEPSFTYHGFRFVEITGFPGKPTAADFEGRVVYDEMPVSGTFQTSDATLNQIYKNAYWGIRGNYRGMPTDCPQRDERMGWLGDRAVGSHGESFIFDNNLLYAKWLQDIEESQREDGSIPDVAPNYWQIYSDNMTWPGAYIIIANMLYEQYGNKEPIRKHYASMKKWMTYMKDKYMVDNIMPKDRYGDWCMPPESPELIHSKDSTRKTDAAVLGTTFYYRMLTLLTRFAGLLDKPDDAKAFTAEAAVIKEAFNNKYFNKQTGYYSNNTVTANILPLSYGMVPEEQAAAVFKNIVDKTTGDFNSHVSTGLVGIQWLMRGLSDHGRADLALKIATNRDYPSWGYMIEKGATTIWELWNGDTADPAMNSANHVMLLGDLIVWFYEYLGGIQNAPGSAGFKEIVMKPYPIDGLDFVNASYRSVHGIIKSEWKKEGGSFIWHITIPCNTKATVYLPVGDGKYEKKEVLSGDYSFTTKL